MITIKDMSTDEFEMFIEQKILQILGDIDSNLQLNDDFKLKLKERLSKDSDKISRKEVLKRFGGNTLDRRSDK